MWCRIISSARAHTIQNAQGSWKYLLNMWILWSWVWPSKLEDARTHVAPQGEVKVLRVCPWLSVSACSQHGKGGASQRKKGGKHRLLCVLLLIESANLKPELAWGSNWNFARICPNRVPLESWLSLQPSGMKLNRGKTSIRFDQFNLKCETADMCIMLHWNAAQNCAQYKAKQCAI